MKFLKFYYVGEAAKDLYGKFIKGLKKGKSDFECYVISIPPEPHEQLDIMHGEMFLSRYVPDREERLIVGLAAGKNDAVSLVGKITEESVAAGFGGRIREFLLDKAEREGMRIL